MAWMSAICRSKLQSCGLQIPNTEESGYPYTKEQSWIQSTQNGLKI